MDDLWANVAAHAWGSQYAIAFYEDRTGKGLNYNLNIEVGRAFSDYARDVASRDER